MPLPPPPSIDTSPISKGSVSITPNLLSKKQVKALLDDAKNLHLKGAFVPGGLRRRKTASRHKQNNDTAADAMKTTTDATTRICDICGIFDDAEAAGPSDARDDLLELMADLRDLLQIDLGIRLSESMELQYLRYPGGDGSNEQEKKSGFYGRHFDSSPEDESTCRRKVSLLLYLNDDTWDVKRDGGVLRAYLPRQQQQSKTAKKRKRQTDGDEERGSIQNIAPTGGTLVLFDSASVEHEVLPTHRERWAVVGWFLLEEDNNITTSQGRKNDRGEGQKRSSQPSHYSGDDQQRRSKKKKKRRRREG
eukprot:scaffold6619_cov146-Skeletonema_menzelii.AAC.10